MAKIRLDQEQKSALQKQYPQVWVEIWRKAKVHRTLGTGHGFNTSIYDGVQPGIALATKMLVGAVVYNLKEVNGGDKK